MKLKLTMIRRSIHAVVMVKHATSHRKLLDYQQRVSD